MHDASQTGYLAGKLLVAVPTLSDPQFSHTLVYVCGHDSQGAMGIIVNKSITALTLADFLSQFQLHAPISPSCSLYYGGSLESHRGFVLHSTDFMSGTTTFMEGDLAVTSTMDILRAIAHAHGPKRYLVALGYVGWGPGQLDHEIRDNRWLVIPPNDDLLFDQAVDVRWRASFFHMGFDPSTLSFEIGHA